MATISDAVKEAMLERLDPVKTPVDIGLAQVILLKRNAAGTDDEIYETDGIYGGPKTIVWITTITDTLEQDAELTFNVEDGVHIEGYQFNFRAGETYSNGGLNDTDTYVFDEDGTFTIANINITVGW